MAVPAGNAFRRLRRVATAVGMIGRPAADLVLPNVCRVCLACLAPDDCHVCADCAADLCDLPEPRCRSCGGATDNALDTCGECLAVGPRPWDHAVSVFRFGGTVRDLIHRLKYQGHTYLAPLFAARMAAAWRRHGGGGLDAVIPVPMHWAKQLVRGYNQAELLAEFLGAELGVPVLRPLRRVRWTSPQTRLDLSARKSNVAGVFRLRHRPLPADARVVLVDDVLTTGATLGAAADELKRGRAACISVLTAARG